MAGNKYQTLNGSGKQSLVKSNNTSAGAADGNKIVSLNAAGKIDPSMLDDLDVINLPSFEDLTSGDYVNIFDDGGVVKVRKADNSNGRNADGYIKDTVIAPATVNVFFEGANTNLAGLTEGARYYLGVTGGVIEVPLDPTSVGDDGKLHQFLGKAVSATEINTDIADCIVL